MNEIKTFTKGSQNFLDLVKIIKYRYKFKKENPFFFNPSGIWVFCGPQGSGKTLSAIQCLYKMLDMYPNAIVVSNLNIKGVPYVPFDDYNQLVEMDNGTDGIIFFIDEIHVLWNSLESKNIPISEMACFCQMRKSRRVIIGTSQVYSRIAKPIREQLQYCIACHSVFFGLIQVNEVLDCNNTIEDSNGHISAPCLYKNWWFHSPMLYDSYDTLNKINRIERDSRDWKGGFDFD